MQACPSTSLKSKFYAIYLHNIGEIHYMCNLITGDAKVKGSLFGLINKPAGRLLGFVDYEDHQTILV